MQKGNAAYNSRRTSLIDTLKKQLNIENTEENGDN